MSTLQPACPAIAEPCAPARQLSLHDRLCDAIGACDDMEAEFLEAERRADAVYARLPDAAGVFIDADKHGLDVSMQRRANMLLRAFLVGQVTREEYEADKRASADGMVQPPASPYEKVNIFDPSRRYVPDGDRPFHRAWAEGFKTDEQRESEAAERQAEEAQQHGGGIPFLDGRA